MSNNQLIYNMTDNSSANNVSYSFFPPVYNEEDRRNGAYEEEWFWNGDTPSYENDFVEPFTEGPDAVRARDAYRANALKEFPLKMGMVCLSSYNNLFDSKCDTEHIHSFMYEKSMYTDYLDEYIKRNYEYFK